MRYTPLVLLMLVSAAHAQSSWSTGANNHNWPVRSEVVACDEAGTCKVTTTVAGCPDNDDLMWCLRNKSDTEMHMLPGGKVQFKPNEAMVEYIKRSPPHGCWGSWDDPKCP